MGRMACVDLPAFPLQLLLKRNPEWQTRPVAVVDSDNPQGVILWVNDRARGFRILPGMRYAAGLSLAGDLRAAVVPQAAIESAVARVARQLRCFTPLVEPAAGQPGVFWLDASGLERLHDSLNHWAGLIRSAMKRQGLNATVMVGYNRFCSYALARAKRGIVVFESAAAERAAARRVPLDRLTFQPKTRDALDRLGIRDVGSFIDLPAAGVGKRFGPEAMRLHRLASGALLEPLAPELPEPPPVEREDLEHPETDVQRLMHVIEILLRRLLRTLAGRNQALAEIVIGFQFERLSEHSERVRPAEPTLNLESLLGLVRLRLSAVGLPDGVATLLLAARGSGATREQLELFARKPRRDPAAANRALARVRAELGNTAVIRARLREGHLPEGRFTWETLDSLAQPRPRDVAGNVLVRRIFDRPIALPSRSRQEPDGWLLSGLEQGPVVRVQGPFIVSGGWWRRPVHREYHFAETRKGEVLWVFYDRVCRRWFMQGRVE